METTPLHQAIFVWFAITLLIASYYFVYSLGRNRPKKIHLINWSRLPFPGAILEEHQGAEATKIEKRRRGLYVDGRLVVLNYSPFQLSKMVPNGHQLRNELRGRPVLNANLLYFLMEHPQFIPKDWKAKTERDPILRIYFWGTIYRDIDGSLYVCCLYWFGGRWHQSFSYLHEFWSSSWPTAVLESHPQESQT